MSGRYPESSSLGASPEVVFVTVSNFAHRVSASRALVRTWIGRGMPACRVDRHWRIELAAALEWMRRGSHVHH